MNAFWGLIKKDMMLMRFPYFIWLVCLLLGMGASFRIANKVEDLTTLVPIYIFALGIQVVLMPVMMIIALRMEGKTQMWLYNPQSSMKLFLSKLGTTFILQLFSQLLLVLYGVVIFMLLSKHDMMATAEEFLPTKLMFTAHIGIISFSIYYSVWIIFYWTVYHSLNKYPKVKNIRWLIITFVFIAINTVESLLLVLNNKKGFIPRLNIEVNPVPSIHYVSESGWKIVRTDSDLTFPIVEICMYILITIVLFLISSRLLDKKVEV